MFLFLLMSAFLSAETLTRRAPMQGDTTGTIDLRPSYSFGERELRTETLVEAGYQWDSRIRLSIAHNFHMRLASPTPRATLYRSVDAYARLKIDRIWQSEDDKTIFAFESRVYGPFDDVSATSGFVSAIRNYFKLKHSFAPSFSLALMELPIFIINRQAGYIDSNGKKIADPFYENRIYLIPEWTYKRLTVSLPIMFHTTRHSNFQAGAENNDGWSFFAWIYPEISYQLDSKSSVGLSFYSDNLLTPTGVANGVSQIFFTTIL